MGSGTGTSKHMLREAVVVYRQHPLTLATSGLGLGRAGVPAELGEVARAWIGERAQEHIVAFALDARGTVIGAAMLGIGGASWASVSRLELLRFLMVSGATGVVLAHNHPSGQVEPSPEDLQLTAEVYDGCKAVDMQMLDHVIVGAGTRRTYSFHEAGMMP